MAFVLGIVGDDSQQELVSLSFYPKSRTFLAPLSLLVGGSSPFKTPSLPSLYEGPTYFSFFNSCNPNFEIFVVFSLFWRMFLDFQ